jgi:hypothetical protein
MPWIDDPVTTPPSLTGHSRAWRVDLAKIKASGLTVDNGCVACWLVEAPWAHPIWHSYRISVAHLHPLARVPDPVIYRPGATHEMVVLALDPRAPRQPLLDRGEGEPLFPVNFAAQMIETNDATAALKVERAVEMIVAGRLSPDTDFLSHWSALFGDDMMLDRRLKQ